MIRYCTYCSNQVSHHSRKACDACQTAHTIYMAFGTGKHIASYEIAKAKYNEEIPSAAAFDCVDCGAPACQYDHRDYSKPLDVAPVCRRCNLLRGRAKPKDWTFEQFWEWFVDNFSTVEKSHHHAHANRITKKQFLPIARHHWPELAKPTRPNKQKETT